MTTDEITKLESVFGRVLELAHDHLGLDVAWLSEFRGGEQRVVAVAGDGASFDVAPGTPIDHGAAYCSRVVAGALPNAIPDVKRDPRTRDMPVTSALDVGAYVGVPVSFPDGQLFGMLCSLSHTATPVVERDVRFLAMLATLLAEELAKSSLLASDRQARRDRIRSVIEGDDLRIVYQPIVQLETMRVAGAEALARFDAEPRNPALWFSDAAMLDMGVELELAAIARALDALESLPADTYLSVNASPATILSPALHDLLAGACGDRILLEITEQAAIAEYEPVIEALRRLRGLGARVAVDDAGAGYASLNHILRLRPDVIKLDIELTRDIDSDPSRQALARALVEFGRSIGATMVAEGVETQGELDMLVWLGVQSAQGYFLARPGDLPLPALDCQPSPIIRRDESAARDRIELSPELAAVSDEAFVRALLEEVVALTGLESSYLTFHDEGALEHRWVHNGGSLRVPEPFTIPHEDSLCFRSRRAGLIWTASVPTDLPGNEMATAAGIQTFASLPVGAVDEHGRSGTLCALGRDARYLDAATLARLEGLAGAIAERLAPRA